MSGDKPVISGRIEQRAAKVSLVTGVSTILAVVFQLTSVPVCLRYWGRAEYGSWLALFSAFLFLRSLDSGYVAFVGNKVNYLYHRDIPALRCHLGSARTGIAVIGVIQLTLAALAAVLPPLASMIGMPGERGGAAAAGLGLLVMTISWVITGSYIGIIHRLMIPAGLMYEAGWWAMALQVSQFAAIMFGASMKMSLLQTSALFAASQLIVYVSSAIYVRRKLPAFAPWWQSADAGTGMADLGRSLMLAAGNLIQQGASNGIVLTVAALAGPVGVPVFTTVRTVANLWATVSTVLTGPLLPDVVRIHAKGEVRKLAAISLAFWVLVGTAVNAGALLAYPLIPMLYGHWTAHSVSLDKPLLCLLLGAVVVANSSALMALHLNGINRLGIVFAASVARAALGLGGGALVYVHFGLTGFGLGILLGEIAATLMTARFFVLHELAEGGVHLPTSSYVPVLLSTGTTLAFFVGTALGWWANRWIWAAAVAGVAAAAFIGWNALDAEVRGRVRHLAFSPFRPVVTR